ncbi:MAG: zf-HC2 domain-containing protein [Chloroflexota bacterium]
MSFRGNHVDELISASLTGDLTSAERLELDAHLARCETCRATLAAFTAERRILAGLPSAEPPRDLSARVRTGIEAGRFRSGGWWRRRGIVASLATVATAALAVVVLSKLQFGPVGHASAAPHPSTSSAPSSSAVGSAAPTVAPTPGSVFALGPGELGYLSLNGAPFQASRLTFVNDATGASLDLGTVSGPPLTASLSPDGQWLAYITQKGESGANQVSVLHLTEGKVTALGCSMAGPFIDRLVWSPSPPLLLGYTLTAVDLGPSSGCAANDGKPGTTDPWLFDTTGTYPPSRVTRLAPNAYAGSFLPGSGINLIESKAGAQPSTVVTCWFCDGPVKQTIDGVFIPAVSPDGNRAIFWTGTMASSGGGWQFSLGGMPQLSRDFRSAGPVSPWVGTPLFSDLTPVGGEAFASGKFAWGPDSDLIAFWDGAWTGAPQGADGTYPSQQAVYVGRISTGLLSKASRLPLALPKDGWIVDVAFAPDAASVAVTIGVPSAGIGDPPSAYLEIVSLASGEARKIGGGAEPPAWDGPAVFGR